MSTKMEQLLDLLVNEEMDQAHALFHEIVVEKSREIYENLIAEEAEEEQDESVEEETEEESDEKVDEETTFEIGGDDEGGLGGLGGDPADDLGGDVVDQEFGGGDDEFGGDDIGGEFDKSGTEEERIEDLEDALEELKAEFEKLMAGEADEPEHDDMFGGDEGGEEDGEEDDGEEDDGEEADGEEDDGEEEFEERMLTREYVEQVGNDWNKSGSMKTPGPVGGGKGELAGQTSVSDTKSPVSSGKGKPTTGATAHNILGGGKGVGEMSGTSPNADKGSRGLVGATKGEFTKGVEKNIAGSSKTKMPSGSTTSKVTAGHGAERKGGAPGPVGAGTGDKAGQTNIGVVKSPLNGAPNRNA